MMKKISVAAGLFVLFTILTGIVYPVLITLAGQVMFPAEANSSLVTKDSQIVGSVLIAQKFSAPGYFHPRPSATGYETLPSGASNLGPSSEELKKQIDYRRDSFISANQVMPGSQIPAEMMTASGSGLDPHISPEAARLQARRIAQARQLGDRGVLVIYSLIDSLTEKPQFHLFGEYRVNVLLLNLELDKLKSGE